MYIDAFCMMLVDAVCICNYVYDICTIYDILAVIIFHWDSRETSDSRLTGRSMGQLTSINSFKSWKTTVTEASTAMGQSLVSSTCLLRTLRRCSTARQS